MSDLITTAQDRYRDACIDAYGFVRSLAERARDQRGQTAAEYMGVLVVIAAIIAVLATTSIGDTLKGHITSAIDNIFNGSGSGGGGGNGGGGGGAV